MDRAKIFRNGGSQAVRLPKACQFATDEVCAQKVGDMVVLFPADKAWDAFGKSIELFSDDYMRERDQGEQHQRREAL